MRPGVFTTRIQDQIDELFSSILLEQRKINQIRPPLKEQEQLLINCLSEFGDLKGAQPFFNYISSGRGHGPFTELIDGSIKYDLIGGMGFNLLGHSHPLYIKALLESSTTDTVMCGNLLPHLESYNLTKNLLSSVQNSRLRHFWFACSGAYANDSALKIIWQKQAPKYRILAFRNSFAGRTVAAQDLSYDPDNRINMPQTVHVDHVPHYDYKYPDLSIKQTLECLNNYYAEYPDSYCAIMIELIQGSAGFVYGTKEYYQTIFEWAKDKGLYVWVDEVQTFARTRELFAFQMFELDNYVDIVTIGKTLQGCGTLYTEELNPKPGLISGTFNGSVASLNAGNKILTYLKSANFYGIEGRNHQIEKTFLDHFTQLCLQTGNSRICEVRGIGTMISFQVGNGSKEITINLVKLLFKNGIISFLGGKDPYRVRFLVPLTLTNEHIQEIFLILEKSLEQIIPQ